MPLCNYLEIFSLFKKMMKRCENSVKDLCNWLHSFIESLTSFILNLYSLIMKMVRIKFKGTENDAIGFLELSKRIRVVCLPGDTYEIPFSALDMIDSLNIPYTVIETEGFDNAIRKIRDTASAKI